MGFLAPCVSTFQELYSKNPCMKLCVKLKVHTLPTPKSGLEPNPGNSEGRKHSKGHDISYIFRNFIFLDICQTFVFFIMDF